MSVDSDIRDFRDSWAALRGALGTVIVGHEEPVEQLLTAFFAGGHVLLEGVPGLGKTMLVRTLARAAAVVASAMASSRTPWTFASSSAAWTTKAGSLRLPLCGWGARKGQSVSTRVRSRGTTFAASRVFPPLG